MADPMVTPAHIVPEWYFLPFYAILRSIPDKLGGVCAMFGAILILFVLPWLDSSKVRSARYRPMFKILTLMFLQTSYFGYIGGKLVEEPYTTIGICSTAWYFFHMIIALPIVSRFEKTKPLPESINDDYQSSH